MDFRKIQKTRGGTFFVTLPKKWILQNQIKAGMLVQVLSQSNGRLQIDARHDTELPLRTAIIDIGKNISREVIAKYLLGYDIIRVQTKDRITIQQRTVIKETSTRLIGLEIIEENSRNLVLQCLLQPTVIPPERILLRQHSIAAAMYRDAANALLEGDMQLAKGVIARDNEVDRLYFLLVRILRTIIQIPDINVKLNVEPIDCLDYRLVGNLVETIGDQASQIAEHVARIGTTTLDPNLKTLISNLQDRVFYACRDSVTVFLSHNPTKAQFFRDQKNEIDVMIRKAELEIGSVVDEVSKSIISILALTNSIYDSSVDISDLTTSSIE